MERRRQTIEEIVSGLSSLAADWEDETARKAIALIEALPLKVGYAEDDVERLLDPQFRTGLLVARLFLGFSDDEMETKLKELLGEGGTGQQRFKNDKTQYLAALTELGLLDQMDSLVQRKAVWSDVLVERLRSGRGKAVRGQRRGRALEDFVEQIVAGVFGKGQFETRCQFVGANGDVAKCDFAIPSKAEAQVLIEVKAYGATGSKMTDVIGDLNTIVEQKRHDTTLILFTDGITWKRRLADLEKIVSMQNRGLIARIYTTQMVEQFRSDLEILKAEHRM